MRLSPRPWFRARGVLPVLVALVAMGATPAAHADSLPAPELATPGAGVTLKANPEFTWGSVPRAARYRIQVSTTSAFTSITLTADVYGTTATPASDLPLGTLHWRVAALDGSNVLGPYSAVRSFTRAQADAPVLVAPGRSTDPLLYPDQVPVLSWQPVAGMQQYRVQVDDESTFTNAAEYTTSATSFALPTALPSNATRFWRVQGISTTPSVTTAWSDAAEAPLAPRSFGIAWKPGSAPAPLGPVDSAVLDADDVEFSWSAVPGAAKYEIQTSTTPDFTEGYFTSQVTY